MRGRERVEEGGGIGGERNGGAGKERGLREARMGRGEGWGEAIGRERGARESHLWLLAFISTACRQKEGGFERRRSRCGTAMDGSRTARSNK